MPAQEAPNPMKKPLFNKFLGTVNEAELMLLLDLAKEHKNALDFKIAINGWAATAIVASVTMVTEDFNLIGYVEYQLAGLRDRQRCVRRLANAPTVRHPIEKPYVDLPTPYGGPHLNR